MIQESDRKKKNHRMFAWKQYLAVSVVLLAGIAAYWNSFEGDFVFDDIAEIRDNPSIGTLWPPSVPMFTGRDLPTRPVPYYSFAINHAIHDTQLFGYHAVNLAVHLVNAMLIFVIVRSTLTLPDIPASLRENANSIALTSSVLWVVHPLNTSAVTYIYQRIESMMAMFFLLTLYLFVRSERSQWRSLWLSFSVVTASIGMACKEVMIVVPVVIGLYDYAFFRKNIRELLSVHWKYYIALLGTWSIIFASMWLQIEKYGNKTHTAWQHAITQPGVILHYLRLSFVPKGQNFDPAWKLETDFLSAQPEFAIVLFAFAAAACLYPRYPRTMFPVCVVFVVLSPSSSFVPVANLADEYRMYIPLGAITTGFSVTLVALMFTIKKYWGKRISLTYLWTAYWLTVTLGCLVLAGTTAQRNALYKDKRELWMDAIEKSPDNPRAHLSYAIACLEKAMPEMVLEHGLVALSLQNDYPLADLTVGISLLQLNRPEEAVVHLRRSSEAKNASWLCYAENNLGIALSKLGQTEEAIKHFERVIELDNGFAEAYLNLGNALRRSSEAEAVEAYRKAIEVNPKYSEAYNNLGLLLKKTSPDEALALFEQAIRSNARNANAYCSKGNELTRRGRFEEAIPCYRQALEIDPTLKQAQQNLDVVIRMTERQLPHPAN
jgi:protein O-mannosyl-transferase